MKNNINTPQAALAIGHFAHDVTIYPIKKTSSLGLSMLIIGLLATVPLILFIVNNIPTGNEMLRSIFALYTGIFIILIPVTIYTVIQMGNKIAINTKTGLMKYQTALGTSVTFYYKERSTTGINIVYFSNTSAQSRFNNKGWASFYRGKEMLFRLNMERWDVADLWWMAENLPARIMVIHERTGYKYIEKRFPGYYPMFAVMPILSGVLIILGVSAGLILEFLLWIATFQVFGI